MKKLSVLIIIVIVGVGIAFYFIRDKSPETTKNIPTTNNGKNFHPDPSNATFILDDETIILSRGKNEKTLPGTGFTEETVLLDTFAYGDINDDDKPDTALFLVNAGGGSGTFLYVAAYVSGPVNYKGSAATFLGDRVSPESISINSSGIVTVKYLDRKPDEAFAAEPTVSVTKQFAYKNGELVEK